MRSQCSFVLSFLSFLVFRPFLVCFRSQFPYVRSVRKLRREANPPNTRVGMIWGCLEKDLGSHNSKLLGSPLPSFCFALLLLFRADVFLKCKEKRWEKNKVLAWCAKQRKNDFNRRDSHPLSHYELRTEVESISKSMETMYEKGRARQIAIRAACVRKV